MPYVYPLVVRIVLNLLYYQFKLLKRGADCIIEH